MTSKAGGGPSSSPSSIRFAATHLVWRLRGGTRRVSAAFSTPKHCARSPIPRGLSATMHSSPHRGQVVPYGDARVDRLHQARQLHERRGRVQLCRVRGSGPKPMLPRLRRVGHWNKVHGPYCYSAHWLRKQAVEMRRSLVELEPRRGCLRARPRCRPASHRPSPRPSAYPGP